MRIRIFPALARLACPVIMLVSVSEQAFAPAPPPILAAYASGNGDDTNDCLSPATPCREIAAARSKLIPGSGTVYVLPGDYRGFVINNANVALNIVATSPGQASVTNYGVNVPPIGGATVGITGDEGHIRLSGFVLSSPGLRAVAITANGLVTLENCTFQSDVPFAVEYAPAGYGQLSISNSRFEGGGLWVKPSGSGSARVVVDNVNIEDPIGGGILVDGNATTGANIFVLRNSVVAGATYYGLFVRDIAMAPRLQRLRS